MENTGLPSGGKHPFKPKLVKNRKGEIITEKKAVRKGPKKGKPGFVDEQNHIWVKDRAHGYLPGMCKSMKAKAILELTLMETKF